MAGNLTVTNEQMVLPWDMERADIAVPKKPQAGTNLLQISYGMSPVFQTEAARPTSGQDLFKYGTFARNPVAKMALDVLESSTFLVPWTIVPQNDLREHPEWEDLETRIRADISRQIDGLKDQTLEMSLRAHFRNCVEYGLGILEWVYPPYLTMGKYTVERLNARGGYDFDVYVDQTGALEQLMYYESGQYIQREDLARYAVTPYPYLRNGNWYGESMLQSVFHDIQLLEALEQCLIQGANLLSVRPILLWYEQGQSEAELAGIMSNLLQLSSGGVAKMPMEMPLDSATAKTGLQMNKVEVLDDRASAEGQKAITEAIDLLSKRIARALAMADDLGYSNANAGSFAKAKEEMNLYIAKVIQMQEFVEHSANQVIVGMVRYNWQNTPDGFRFPRFQFDQVKEDRSETIAKTFLPLVEMGLIEAQVLADKLEVPLSPEFQKKEEPVIAGL